MEAPQPTLLVRDRSAELLLLICLIDLVDKLLHSVRIFDEVIEDRLESNSSGIASFKHHRRAGHENRLGRDLASSKATNPVREHVRTALAFFEFQST